MKLMVRRHSYETEASSAQKGEFGASAAERYSIKREDAGLSVN